VLPDHPGPRLIWATGPLEPAGVLRSARALLNRLGYVLAWLARKLRPDEHPSKEPPLATDNWQPATGKKP